MITHDLKNKKVKSIIVKNIMSLWINKAKKES